MKVLLANGLNRVGGVTTFMLSLRAALRSQGHDCDLFFFEHGPADPLLPRDGSVHFGNLADCLRLVDRRGIEVVHTNNVDWSLGLSAVRQLGAKLVLTAHKVRPVERAYGWSHRTCDAFTTVAGWIKNELQSSTDLPIQSVPNGIDIQQFSPEPRDESSRPIVAWVGRGSSPRKRLESFAAVAPALRAAGIRIWVIDPHGPRRVAESLPDAVGTLEPIAEFWGGVTYERMPDLYREVAASGGCIVSTATDEGLPLTLLEAQACGCSVVASDVVGNNECVFPEHGGTLFPLDLDAASLSDLILEAVSDRARVRQQQDAAMRYVREHFSLDRMARRYADIYVAAPYSTEATLAERLRGGLLSPLADYRQYVAWRWSVGVEQYDWSRRLADSGDTRAAAAAGRASFAMSPTIFARPGRLAHLLKLYLR